MARVVYVVLCSAGMFAFFYAVRLAFMSVELKTALAFVAGMFVGVFLLHLGQRCEAYERGEPFNFWR